MCSPEAILPASTPAVSTEVDIPWLIEKARDGWDASAARSWSVGALLGRAEQLEQGFVELCNCSIARQGNLKEHTLAVNCTQKLYIYIYIYIYI